MNITDLQRLTSEKGDICISIIVPTHRYSNERMQNPAIVFKAIQKAKEMLNHKMVSEETTSSLTAKLDLIEKQIDYVHLQEGLGIFVSQNVSNIYSFPVIVKEKIIIENKFPLLDLYYLAQYSQPYYLLAISKKRVPLYRCEGRHMQEITNEDFPKQYSEEYEYAYPSLGSSSGPGLKNVEGDKSVLAEKRQIGFIRQIDKTIDKYLKNGTPLIVAGVDEELANFHHTTHHEKSIVGVIKGNYSVDALHSLSNFAWEKIKVHIQANHQSLLELIQEDIGKKLAVVGIRDVWSMAKLGKGMTLLVEKDYHARGFVDPSNEVKLYLNPPRNSHQIVADAVEEIISTVADKKGNIVVVENGALENHGGIALRLRYPS